MTATTPKQSPTLTFSAICQTWNRSCHARCGRTKMREVRTPILLDGHSSSPTRRSPAHETAELPVLVDFYPTGVAPVVWPSVDQWVEDTGVPDREAGHRRSRAAHKFDIRGIPTGMSSGREGGDEQAGRCGGCVGEELGVGMTT